MLSTPPPSSLTPDFRETFQDHEKPVSSSPQERKKNLQDAKTLAMSDGQHTGGKVEG